MFIATPGDLTLRVSDALYVAQFYQNTERVVDTKLMSELPVIEVELNFHNSCIVTTAVCIWELNPAAILTLLPCLSRQPLQFKNFFHMPKLLQTYDSTRPIYCRYTFK